MSYPNDRVVALLREIAGLLEERGDNPFRVAAYRRAIASIEALTEPLARIIERHGVAGIDAIPGIGMGLARLIGQIVESGQSPVLNRLRASRNPAATFRTLPGIGPKLADRLASELGVTSLEGLEVAVHSGDLARLPGFGAKRIEGIRGALAGRLHRWQPVLRRQQNGRASVVELLDIDREYRQKAEAGLLPKIAPRRFNPSGIAWLPVLHASRHGRRFTALHSNTARAHALDRVQDWVVIYADEGGSERAYTVVTERRGPLAGKRVVRGREAGCMAHYRGHVQETFTDPSRLAG